MLIHRVSLCADAETGAGSAKELRTFLAFEKLRSLVEGGRWAGWRAGSRAQSRKDPRREGRGPVDRAVGALLVFPALRTLLEEVSRGRAGL